MKCFLQFQRHLYCGIKNFVGSYYNIVWFLFFALRELFLNVLTQNVLPALNLHKLTEFWHDCNFLYKFLPEMIFSVDKSRSHLQK